MERSKHQSVHGFGDGAGWGGSTCGCPHAGEKPIQQIISIGAESSLSYTPPGSFDLSRDRIRDPVTGFGNGESGLLEGTEDGLASIHHAVGNRVLGGGGGGGFAVAGGDRDLDLSRLTLVSLAG